MGKTTLSEVIGARRGDVRTGIGLWRLPWAALLPRLPRLATTFGALSWHARSPRWWQSKEIFRLEAMGRFVGSTSLRRYRALVLDEGPVFTLSRLHLFAPDVVLRTSWSRWLDAAIEAWARALDIVILLDAPDPVLARRIRRRSKPHLVKNGTDHDMAVFAASYRAAFAHVLRALAAHGGPPVVRITTADEPVEQLAEQVLAVLEKADGR
ncbi:MAG TPA: hypothetical protein VNN19_10465 [bacterium]|nr:hypothetical protein [bacterium]